MFFSFQLIKNKIDIIKTENIRYKLDKKFNSTHPYKAQISLKAFLLRK